MKFQSLFLPGPSWKRFKSSTKLSVFRIPREGGFAAWLTSFPLLPQNVELFNHPCVKVSYASLGQVPGVPLGWLKARTNMSCKVDSIIQSVFRLVNHSGHWPSALGSSWSGMCSPLEAWEASSKPLKTQHDLLDQILNHTPAHCFLGQAGPTFNHPCRGDTLKFFLLWSMLIYWYSIETWSSIEMMIK